MKFHLAVAFCVATTAAVAAANGPAPGPLHIIGGGNAGGCIAGAISLPPEGPGFQTIHLNRSAFWGAPETIADLELFALRARDAGFPTLLLEDISLPRGGPMPGGHVAHQVGLEADVALDMRPRGPVPVADLNFVELRTMVRADGKDVDMSVWSARETELLKMAAELPDVDRILVNPAIKQQLCREVTGDRSWLRLIRPWYGHAAHMHIRFRCPAGQAECVQAAPPPPGDGCDDTLAWWFRPKPAVPETTTPAKPPKPPSLPPGCRAMLGGAS